MNDLYKFIPSTATWTTLYPPGQIPVGRVLAGFTSNPDGILYLYGGYHASYGQC
jgi:hypothetical protein